MLSKFHTVYEGGEAEIIEKKSRFIATVLPVTCEEEALEFIESMKKKYWNATHNCYAYVIGERFETQRCSDDGEPQGTAGKPILDVLKGSYMEEQKEQYGLVYKSRPPYEVLYTKWLPYSDVLRLKRVEEMVEVYYNSRQFSYTLGALEKAFPDSFSMYEQLGAYYDEEGQTFLSHARVTRYEILYAFAKKIDPEREELYRELLIFDFYLRENAKSRPAFAGEETVKKEEQQQFYDEEAKAHKYLVGYEKWDKRQLRKMTHIERFGYRVTEDAARGETVLLFDYQNRNPLNYEARVVEVCEMEEETVF